MAETVEFQLNAAKDEAVTVAYVCSDSVVHSWHRSMVEMLGFDGQRNRRVMTGGFIAMRCGTNGLVEARNTAVKTFLEQDKADWLFWVDTDMGFEADCIDRLFEAADPVDRPIVGALCFSWREDEPDTMGGYRHTATPTVLDWRHVDGQYGWEVRWQFPVNTLTRVGGTGAACILVHRSVFEKIEAEHGRVWYDRVPNTSTGQLIGEDLSFCLRAGALQIPVFVHTGIPTTHHKSFWLSEEDYWRQVAINSAAEEFAKRPPAPPDPKDRVDVAAALIKDGVSVEDTMAAVFDKDVT